MQNLVSQFVFSQKMASRIMQNLFLKRDFFETQKTEEKLLLDFCAKLYPVVVQNKFTSGTK